jgi:hypothetical protein
MWIMASFLRLRTALLAVLTVALVATGWAHRVPAPSDEAVLAFLQATGATAADYCGEAGDRNLHGDPLCQACQISGAADLPPSTGAVHPVEFVAILPPGPRPLPLIVRVLDLSHAPQAPPIA